MIFFITIFVMETVVPVSSGDGFFMVMPFWNDMFPR